MSISPEMVCKSMGIPTCKSAIYQFLMFITEKAILSLGQLVVGHSEHGLVQTCGGKLQNRIHPMMDHQSVTFQLAVDGGISHGKTMKNLLSLLDNIAIPRNLRISKCLLVGTCWYLLRLLVDILKMWRPKVPWFIIICSIKGQFDSYPFFIHTHNGFLK